MKTAPSISPPTACRSDIVEARQVLGQEPKWPVGVVLSPYGLSQLRAYGCRFPCPVAVSKTIHRDAVEWFYLQENFQPFTDLIQA